MTLVQSWIDSLTLLKPKNAQLFIMVTIKSIIEAYKVMFLYLWIGMGLVLLFIISFALILPILFDTHGLKESAELGTYMAKESFADWGYLCNISIGWLYQLMLFAACLATRPSIMKKDYTYFKSQISAFIYLIILLALVPTSMWPSSFTPFYIFLVLFFLDSAKGPKNFLLSLWNALKMVVYNFPLLAIMGLCFGVLSLPYIYLIVPFVSRGDTVGIGIVLRDILGLCFLPIGVCLYANIYIKKLHDQFDLYFPRS